MAKIPLWAKVLGGALAVGGAAYAVKKSSDQGDTEDQAEAGGESGATPGTQMPNLDTGDVDKLDLIEPARSMALAVKAAFPTIKFTSGRRTKFSTAKAEVEDGQKVANARGLSLLQGTIAYVTETYKETPAKDALLAALNALPDTNDWMTVQNAILAEINTWSDPFLGDIEAGPNIAGLVRIGVALDEREDECLGMLSRHPGGLAFDMHVDPNIDVNALRTVLQAQPGFDKFLNHEAGQAIWHAQAKVPTDLVA